MLLLWFDGFHVDFVIRQQTSARARARARALGPDGRPLSSRWFLPLSRFSVFFFPTSPTDNGRIAVACCRYCIIIIIYYCYYPLPSVRRRGYFLYCVRSTGERVGVRRIIVRPPARRRRRPNCPRNLSG